MFLYFYVLSYLQLIISLKFFSQNNTTLFLQWIKYIKLDVLSLIRSEMQHTKFPFRLPNKIELLYLYVNLQMRYYLVLSLTSFSLGALFESIVGSVARKCWFIRSHFGRSLIMSALFLAAEIRKHTTVHLWRAPTSLPPRCVSSARGVNRCAQVFPVSQVDYALYDHT